MSLETQIERAVKLLHEFRRYFAPNRLKPTKDTDTNTHTMQESSTRDSSRGPSREFCILCQKKPLPRRHLILRHLPSLSSHPCGAFGTGQPLQGWVTPAQLSLLTHPATLAPGNSTRIFASLSQLYLIGARSNPSSLSSRNWKRTHPSRLCGQPRANPEAKGHSERGPVQLHQELHLPKGQTPVLHASRTLCCPRLPWGAGK